MLIKHSNHEEVGLFCKITLFVQCMRTIQFPKGSNMCFLQLLMLFSQKLWLPLVHVISVILHSETFLNIKRNNCGFKPSKREGCGFLSQTSKKKKKVCYCSCMSCWHSKTANKQNCYKIKMKVALHWFPLGKKMSFINPGGWWIKQVHPLL